jgi:cell division septation protein DedD
MEARALAQRPAPVEDPLAALDQLGEVDETDGLTFHRALTRGEAGKSESPKRAEAKPESKRAEAKVEPPKKPEPLKKPEVPDPPRPAELAPMVAEATPEPKPPTAAPGAAAAAPAPKPVKPEPKPEPLPAARAQVLEKKPAKKPDGATSHFTLQLSAFPDKADAEEFMHRIQAAGYKPFVVASEIPGKGLFYRVRAGDYSTRQAALDAKTEFERKQRLIAYVAKL